MHQSPFRTWVNQGTVTLDNYREFDNAGTVYTPDEHQTFTYDALDRLISATQKFSQGGYTAAYTYDVLGNLLTKTEGPETFRTYL